MKENSASRTIEQWPTDRPIPYARNARVIPDQAIGKVAASIKEFGFRAPILVDGEGVIIAGHTRLLAAQRLQLEHVPVIVCDDLSDAQVKAYRLTDNRTAQESSWDYELLNIELGDLATLDIDLSLTGFDPDELAAWLDGSDESTGDGSSGSGGSLADRFLVPPFSVLDTRQGYWQDRKRSWLALGIKSELGRGGNLTMGQDIIGGQWDGYEA